MRLSRIGFCLAGWLGVCLGPLRAQDAWMPYVFGRQYCATEVITTGTQAPVESRIYVDTGRIRLEMPSAGGKVIAIVRPDMQTVYWVLVARKQLLMLPYDPERMKKVVPPVTAIPGHTEPLGIDTILGVLCKKYRLTNESGRPFLLWTDAAQETPVKIAAEDGTCTLVWKNYQAGPQQAGLFAPPDNFEDVQMPLPMKLPAPLRLPPKDLGE